MFRRCLECQNEVSGRSDKKFCTDYCRSVYHNRRHAELIKLRRRINRILSKNRNILASLNPHGKRTLHKHTLMEEGFNFNYFTNQYITKKGTVYFFCYDQGYLSQDGEWFTLVERKKYIH